MPNKTIYVAEADLELFQRAQELAGGNLSQAITRALRRFIAAEEGALEGLREVTVKVGPGQARKQRFMGVLVAELGSSTSDDVAARPRLPHPGRPVRGPHRAFGPAHVDRRQGRHAPPAGAST